MGDVRLQEVSVSGGSTIRQIAILGNYFWHVNNVKVVKYYYLQSECASCSTLSASG